MRQLLVALADDGSVLAAAPARTTSGYGLYRLQSGMTSWQLIGNLPQLAVTYCPTPGTGMLWALGSDLDPQHRIYTADYAP